MIFYVGLKLMILGVVLSLVILYLFWSSFKGFSANREKSSAFECGLDKKDLSRSPFSLKFFLILILFLIFDVELCLLMGLPYQNYYLFYGKRVFFIFIFAFLLLGVLEEYRRGALNWKNNND